MDNTIVFGRGDGAAPQFGIDASVWQPGGRLFFGAKLAIDDDNSDSAAYIESSWGDEALVADKTVGTVTYKMYNCVFPPSATNSILSNGEDSLDLLGEFQYVPASGIPVTVPVTTKIPVIVYFDVVRKTTA